MITLRVRSLMWFTAGLVLALGFVWGTLAWRAQAAPGASESTIVSVTPTRVLDTRDPRNIGLAGPFASARISEAAVDGLDRHQRRYGHGRPGRGDRRAAQRDSCVAGSSWLSLDPSRHRERATGNVFAQLHRRTKRAERRSGRTADKWAQRRSDRHRVRRVGPARANHRGRDRRGRLHHERRTPRTGGRCGTQGQRC